MPHSFLDLHRQELSTLFRELEIPAFRLNQIRNWIFARKIDRVDEMTNLPKELRQLLAEHFAESHVPSLYAGTLVKQTGSPDTTQKLLLQWPDGHRVECVLLRDDRNHRTGCISTQVGCAMGCVFCASGMDGFVRNLTRGEILEQILRLNALTEKSERLTHLVVMGTGEPLLNLDALLAALEEATAADALDLSARRITISTVGIPKGIEKLAASQRPYKLAVSLHAPNDEIRTRIVPQNRITQIAPLMRAAEFYYEKSGRRITFEYVLIHEINDRTEHAKELAKLLRGKNALVNLIPFNPIPEFSLQSSTNNAVRNFHAILESGGIQVKVRFRKGDDINAACGQLRRSFRS